MSSKALLVCSGGGHLKQLNALSKRFDISPENQTWVTFRNGLSESLLEDRETIFVPFTGPRDYRNFIRLILIARRLVKQRPFDLAISTGSSPALAFLPLAQRRGASSHYIESAARSSGPSVTGRVIAALFPRIQTYTQYQAWSSDRWLYNGSILDGFAEGPRSTEPDVIGRAVVSIGTQLGYQFDRFFAAVVPLLHSIPEVLWQTADQDMSPWGIEGRATVPHTELQSASRNADVIICHAGTGAALTALESGKCPILVPRLSRYGEHVDDHQVQIAQELHRRGVAIAVDPADLTMDRLLEAAQRSIRKEEQPPSFPLAAHASARPPDLFDGAS